MLRLRRKMIVMIWLSMLLMESRVLVCTLLFTDPLISRLFFYYFGEVLEVKSATDSNNYVMIQHTLHFRSHLTSVQSC